jgi:hypothetical protein
MVSSHNLHMNGDDNNNIVANFVPLILQAVAAISEDPVGDIGEQQRRQYAATLREFQQLTANPAGHHYGPRSKRRKFNHASVNDTYVPSYVKENDGDDDDGHEDAPAAAEQQSNSEEEEDEEGAGNGNNDNTNNDDGQKVRRWRDLQD